MPIDSLVSLNREPGIAGAEARICANGEMAERIRLYPWNTTSIGPISQWPDVLVWSINLMLECRFPSTILWGPEMLQFYNDPYLPLTAEKHPSLLGKSAPQQWPEAWHIIGPQFEAVLASGTNIYQENVLVPCLRNGIVQDVYWTYSYSPIRGHHAEIGGILVVCHDVTAKLTMERERDTMAASLKNVLESTTDGLAVLDTQWRYTYMNEQGARMIGLRAEDLIGHRLWDLFPYASESAFGREYLRAVETGKPRHFDAFYPEPLNAWLECHCYPSEHGLSIYFRDVTEQKQIEIALRASESRFRKLFESNMMGIGIPDRFGAFREGNDELLRMTGYTREDLEAGLVRWDTMTPPEYSDLDVFHILEAAERGSCTPYEKEYICKDGMRVPILCGYALLEGSQDEYIGFVLDLTLEKQAESERFAAIQRLKALMQALPVGVSFSDDATCQRISGNPTVLAQFEAGPGDNLSASATDPSVAGRQVQFFKQGRRIDDTELPLQRAVAEDREIEPMELDVHLPSGRRWICEASGAPIRDSKGEVIAGVAVTTDITARKQAEERLRESEIRFRVLAETLPQLIWMSDAKGNTTYCNRRVAEYFGTDPNEADTLRWRERFHPDDVDRVFAAWWQSVESLQPYQVEYRLRRHDGQYRAFLVRALPVRNKAGEVEHWIGSSTDVHDQKIAEEGLRRTEKLATAGRLAASIAHEINNPLASVTNALYLALKDTSLQTETRNYLTLCEQELARVAQITTQTLRFHRQSKAAASADVCEVMDSVLALFKPRLADRQIEVVRRCQPGALVDCFADEVRQVFANLVGNALDATQPGGAIHICIARTNAWDAQRTPGVKVIVADTGHGISATIKHRLFEPFVSTKEATGVGLGLWVSEGIIRKHQGRIRIRSTASAERHGTVVSLFFPLAGVTA